jgi:hypothetical protein
MFLITTILCSKKAKKTNTIGQWKKIRKIRNKLMLTASNHILIKFVKKINTETNGSKNWWNLVKSLLHSDSGGDQSRLQVVVNPTTIRSRPRRSPDMNGTELTF